MPRYLMLPLFLLYLGCGASPAVAQEEEAAQEAAQQWLALVDAEQYAESYDAMAELVKPMLTPEQWTAQLQQALSPLQNRTSERELIAAKYTESLPNAPKGAYVVAQYRIGYDVGAFTETVTLMKEGEAWKVIGYFIQPV